MREITDGATLAAACGGDTLCAWAAQGLAGGSRAWLSDDGQALAVAGPGLATRDRLAVRGEAGAAAALVRAVLAEVGPTYRPQGDGPLIEAVASRLPGLALRGSFGWMDATRAAPGPPGMAGMAGMAGWLPDAELPMVAEFLAAAYPAAYAKPGIAGVERWAGVRGSDGQLAAVGALAWSAPAVGFIAGMAVAPEARGRGLGRPVGRLLLAEALRRHPAVALMVDDGNAAARALYRRLGLRYRQLGVAAVAG
jgi:ribosomal protein S18 acetylase RimI-like enzyme